MGLARTVRSLLRLQSTRALYLDGERLGVDALLVGHRPPRHAERCGRDADAASSGGGPLFGTGRWIGGRPGSVLRYGSPALGS